MRGKNHFCWFQDCFKQSFRSIQRVRGMLLYRFMQVVLNHLQNQKMFPHFSGLEVNEKIYVVRTSKFQTGCFAPRKQKIEGNTLRLKRRTKMSPTRSSTPGGVRRGFQRGVRREVSWGFSRRTRIPTRSPTRSSTRIRTRNRRRVRRESKKQEIRRLHWQMTSRRQLFEKLESELHIPANRYENESAGVL